MVVQAVYGNGERVALQPGDTIGDAIRKAAANENIEHCCIFFYGNKMENSTKIEQIEHLKSDHTLRILCKKPAIVPNPLSGPSLADLRRAIERLTDQDMTKICDHIDQPNFRRQLVSKFPALAGDPEALNVLTDYSLSMILICENANYVAAHPLLVSVMYAICEAALSPDTFRRLFSNQPLPQQQQLFTADSIGQMLGAIPGGGGGGGGNRGAAPSRTTLSPAASVPSTSQAASTSRGAAASSGITSQMFANALQQALGGAGSGGGSQFAPTTSQAASSSSFASPQISATTAEQTLEQLRTHFAAQLAQMHEFGFVDDVENIQALQAAGGNLETALELVIRLRE